MEAESKIHIWILIIFNVLNQSLKYYSYLGASSFHSDPFQLTYYPICIQLCLIFALVAFERYGIVRREKEEALLFNRQNESNYQNLLELVDEFKKREQLVHDMKNHLLAIRAMSEENESIKSYLESLIKESSNKVFSFNTGLALVDGLLTAKAQVAQEEGIIIKVNMDATCFSFIKAPDLCSILGNAIDNAIEAASKETCPERFIRISSAVISGHVFLKVENPFTGIIEKTRNGLLKTTKKSGIHGLGIGNILYITKRYDGVIDIKTENGIFAIIIMIPLPNAIEIDQPTLPLF